ncbi:uncharacterized protein [Equus asinus]|uniref:uncharacterized protein n=1 Tax=Equus asinus TaxID=9793 RepID=UPI001D04E3A7|nr:classical arabinogalactan protein 1-like [Equus asinus]
MAVAAAASATELWGRRYKKAPQTRRTSLDQPPPPTPPPAALLSAPSAPPAAPSPGDPAAVWAGSPARLPTRGSCSASPGPRHQVLLSPHFTNEASEAFKLSQGYIPPEGIQTRAVSLHRTGFLHQCHHT